MIFGATADTAQTSIKVFWTMFPRKLFSRFADIWPSHSPDLEVPDYFVWGYIKIRVYEKRPANSCDLKQRIQECIQGIPKDMLLLVLTSFPS
jgi:hypothetical protein